MKNNKSLNNLKQSGVSMIETLIAFPVLLVLVMGIIHVGFVYQAQANLEYAALMAARVGAASGINIDDMLDEAEYRIRATTKVDRDDLAAISDVREDLSIEVLNPSYGMFNDCGSQPVDTSGCAYANICEIPYFGQQFLTRGTGCNGASIQDANILRIRVTYNYDSKVPFLNNVHFVGQPVRTDVNDDGIGVSAVATVRMQSPARLSFELLDNYEYFSGIE